jgi:hypothetical protein
MTQSAPGLSGNQKRKMKSASRLYAVQALFQMEHSSQTIDRVRREFIEHRFGAVYEDGEMLDGDLDHFSTVLETAVNHQAAIDQMTDRWWQNGQLRGSTRRCGPCFAPLALNCAATTRRRVWRSRNMSTSQVRSFPMAKNPAL